MLNSNKMLFNVSNCPVKSLRLKYWFIILGLAFVSGLDKVTVFVFLGSIMLGKIFFV